jgi:hypothetical protein
MGNGVGTGVFGSAYFKVEVGLDVCGKTVVVYSICGTIGLLFKANSFQHTLADTRQWGGHLTLGDGVKTAFFEVVFQEFGTRKNISITVS